MNRLLAGARVYTGFPPREFPPINLYVGEHDLVLTLELPGVPPEKVDVSVTGDMVTVAAERPAETVKNGESFHRRERPVGQFNREIKLPFEVDPSKTEATYDKGVLKVTLFRPESLKPRKVAVKVS
jgi:HSP20 family protein